MPEKPYDKSASSNETHQLSYELTRWFGSSPRTEPMPLPSPLTLQRIGHLLADDHETGFFEHVERLATVEDTSLRRALFLYACGYSNEDIEISTGVEQNQVTNAMELWEEDVQNRALGRTSLSEVMTSVETEEGVFQRKLKKVKTEWRKSLPSRSSGRGRIFDGMPDLVIPDLSFIDAERSTALANIFGMVYHNDYPDQSKGDGGDLSRFFVQATVYNHGERKGAQEAGCPKYVAHNFVYGEWGALLLARHSDIFYRAFQDLSEGAIPELPLKEELIAHPAIEAVLDFIDDPRFRLSNDHKSKYGISQPLVYLLERADLSQETMMKLRGVTSNGRRTAAYGLLEFLQQHGVFIDDAARHIGRILLAQKSLSVDEINAIVPEDRRSTTATFYDETAELFSEHSTEVRAIFDELPTNHEDYRVVLGSVQTVFKEVLSAETIERFATLRSGQITLLSHKLEDVYRKGLRRKVSSGGDVAKRHMQVLDLALRGKEYDEIVGLVSPPFSTSTISDTIVGRNLPNGFQKYREEVVQVVNFVLDLTLEQECELIDALGLEWGAQ